MKYNEKNIVIKKLVKILIVILVMLYISHVDQSKAIEIAKYTISDTIKIVEDKKPKSLSNQIFEYIKEQKIENSNVVFAQAKLESNSFKSKLFLNHHNMFGMKIPHSRPTLAIGQTKSGYAIYKSWKDSVKDYALYQKYTKKKGLSQEQYIKRISNNYSVDLNYSNKIRKLIKNL